MPSPLPAALVPLNTARDPLPDYTSEVLRRETRLLKRSPCLLPRSRIYFLSGGTRQWSSPPFCRFRPQIGGRKMHTVSSFSQVTHANISGCSLPQETWNAILNRDLAFASNRG